jgi:hypothetical protein
MLSVVLPMSGRVYVAQEGSDQYKHSNRRIKINKTLDVQLLEKHIYILHKAKFGDAIRLLVIRWPSMPCRIPCTCRQCVGPHTFQADNELQGGLWNVYHYRVIGLATDFPTFALRINMRTVILKGI